MTLPVSGEQHDKAVGDASHNRTGTSVTDTIIAYFASLREQGVVFIEQPRCEACKGGGSDMPPGGQKMTDLVPCSRCNGTGRARMADVNEIVAMLRDPPRFSIYSPSRAEWFRAADFIERRFASEDTAKEEPA